MTNWKEVTLEEGNIWDKENPLDGVLVNVDNEVGPNKSKMYTIKTGDSETKLWGSTVLDDKLMGVPNGTHVKIEYNGKQMGKKGTQYHDFKVFIDLDSKPDEEPAHTEADAPINVDDIPF